MNLPASIIRAVVSRFPAVVPHLNNKARFMAGVALKATPEVNAQYNDEITASLIDYFEGGSIGASRNAFKNAMIQAFADSFDAGWIDGGGELPIDEEAMDWLEGRMNEEAGYIDALFEEAKELRKDNEFDYFSWITARAAGYVSTLGFVYNMAKMMLDKKQMLTWRLGQTEKHCDTCASLDGQRHRASWYIARDYIPRKPAAAMDCGGYNCDCRLENDDGEEVTI